MCVVQLIVHLRHKRMKQLIQVLKNVWTRDHKAGKSPFQLGNRLEIPWALSLSTPGAPSIGLMRRVNMRDVYS